MQENDGDLPITITFINLQSQVSIDVLGKARTILLMHLLKMMIRLQLYI